MPTQIERLEALSSHLLDGFLKLRERYALLEPMLFEPKVAATRGSKKQARGFSTLRHSLFLTCAQDIAKYTTDSDHRTPSIRNIVAALEDQQLLASLREKYAIWHCPLAENETDPEILEALQRMNLREEAERRSQFDEHYRELVALWNKLSATPEMEAYRTVRDKLTAHTEVRLVADKYQLIDIGSLGIKWGHLKTTISEMQRSVELIGLIVRNAGFAWDALDRQLTEAAQGFWYEVGAAS